MLFWLSNFSTDFTLLNIFRYLTFRTGGAVVTAMLIAFVFGPPIIRWLKHHQKNGQPIRIDGPESHILAKKGTPTMGGVMILLSITVATLLWADLSNHYVWAVLITTLGFGGIGFIDDYLKLTNQNSVGLRGRTKLFFETLFSVIVIFWVLSLTTNITPTALAFPFLKNILIDIGWFYIPFAAFIIVGASNAVNLTDGLDGLAIVPVMICASVFLIISYLIGNAVFADYLQVHFVRGTGELAIFCGAIVGAGLGFLWFNAPPAMIFMGDTGSLAMGSALGIISVITKHEIVLGITGGLFVLETISVIVQVVSFKLTGRRVFRMAPLHHHFEKKGWAEATIVIRFWIIACILAIAGLSTLKLR
jgi:phospho-N-acetylmuramoyl-pentapeptide-transferase